MSMKKTKLNYNLLTELKNIFDELNRKYFNDSLKHPLLQWNSRLRSSAGRFIPGTRLKKPTIEVALYLVDEKDSENLIRDTIGHEMIHMWLWQNKKPYGHTSQFKEKMNEMGVSLYNTVPKISNPKYIYTCPNCSKKYPAIRKWKNIACLNCCKKYSNGKYDTRFSLTL